jgi:hypothetical protein
MRLTVRFMPTASDKWHSLGAVTISKKGVPEFPALPSFPTESARKVPGVYRLTFKNGHIYIGKAKDLRGRFANYRTPTSGTEQEHVLRYILLDAGGATAEVIPESSLPSGVTRHALEKEEQGAAIKKGLPLLNTGGLSRGHYLKFKIKYHEDMLAKAHVELESWNARP